MDARPHLLYITVINLIFCCLLFYWRRLDQVWITEKNQDLVADEAGVHLHQEVAPRSVELLNSHNETKTSFLKHLKVKEDQDNLLLEANVSGFGVTVKIDEKVVYQSLNKTIPWGGTQARLHAGIHLVVLHQRTGAVLRSETFMTWQPAAHRMLTALIGNVQDGRILLFCGVPDFTMGLMIEAVFSLLRLGSLFIDKVAYKEAWVLILKKGGKVLYESITTHKLLVTHGNTDASPIIFHIIIQKEPDGGQCKWYSQTDLSLKAKFCNTYGGYGAFCNCEMPWKPRIQDPSSFEMKEVIPIALVTATRIPNILRVIGFLRNMSGGSATPVVVFVDDSFNMEAEALGNLLNVTVVFRHQPQLDNKSGHIDHRMNDHMKFTLTQIFLHFPKSNKIILLEDDLDLAPDLLQYFHQTTALLDGDPSLMCVNAYNFNSFTHTTKDPTRLYRVYSWPAYGWMISRTWAQKIIKQWPDKTVNAGWDLYLRNGVGPLMGEWSIIIPELPRTKHRGGGGAHTTGMKQERFFNQRPLNRKHNVTLDIQGSAVSDGKSYFIHHMNAIADSVIVNIEQHPCIVNPLPTHKTNRSYVIYMNQPSEAEVNYSYYILAKCLGINERDLHESLMFMFTFPFYGNQVYLVACPNSPFCFHGNTTSVYNGTHDDFSYANTHPLRKAGLERNYWRRITPRSFEEEINLENIINIKMYS